MDLQWDQRSGLAHHEVQHRLGTTGSWFTASSNVTGTSYTVSSLTGRTTYNFQVRAFGDGTTYGATWGPYSSPPASAMTPRPPSPPEMVGTPTLRPGNNSLTATWTAPNNGGSAITRYEVQHKRTSDSWPTGSGTDNGTRLTRTITGLFNGTAYHVRVRACNRLGCGFWSPSHTGTPRTVPSQPSQPLLTPGNRSLTATWTSPYNGGSAIARYEVQHKVASDSWPSGSGINKGPGLMGTVPELADLTSYDVRVRACNVAGCGDWSLSATETTKLGVPTHLNVTPLPQRKALLTWTSDSRTARAASFEVEVEDPAIIPPDDPWEYVATVTNILNGHEIKLDDVLNSTSTGLMKKGLANETAYAFRLKAKHTSNPDYDSGYSAAVSIVDIPITSLNGNSAYLGGNQGKAVIKWKIYTNSPQYKARYRQLVDSRLEDIQTDFDHTQLEWIPTLADSWIEENVALIDEDPDTESIGEHTIRGLTKETIYAFQIYYTIGSHTYFAARDAYVWPSDRQPGGGERIATFPLSFPLYDDRDYAYRICEVGFPTDKLEDWKKLINHALGQWEHATDGLVTMSYAGNACADYSDAIQKTIEEIVKKFPGVITEDSIGELTLDQKKYLKGFLAELDTLTAAKADDKKLNEIIMVDEHDENSNYTKLFLAGAFPEMAADLGLAECVFQRSDQPACARPRHDHPVTGAPITDILIRRSPFENHSLDIPGGDESVERSDTPFNTCSTPRPVAYETMLHEGGHVLGIREGQVYDGWTEILTYHPSIADSVMNYESIQLAVAGSSILRKLPDEPDCSPHPFDIMVIYALYQVDGEDD